MPASIGLASRPPDRGLTQRHLSSGRRRRRRIDHPLDVVFVFNSIHDQARPAAVLGQIHDALVPGGMFVMDEPRVSSRLEDNIANPVAPFVYAVSTLHCLTVSLAAGGAGLGTAWGEHVAVEMLRDAGFGAVQIHDAPGDPGNAVFVTTRPERSGGARAQDLRARTDDLIEVRIS